MIDIICKVDEQGIHAPNFDKILEWYHKQYRAVYGEDINLDNSTQDGQWVAIQAQAINACNQAMVAVFNSFSPAKAIGEALSSNVKINGISRMGATHSTCDVIVSGDRGTFIENGIVRDKDNKHNWRLPERVSIPEGEEITVMATCEESGTVYAAPNTLTKIMTPTKGWTSVTNPGSATLGRPVETDAELRIRQKQSTMLPARSMLEGLIAAVRSLPGVLTAQGYENDGTDFTPGGKEIPPHHIGIVVDGGDPQEIAKVIANRKGMGVGTSGTTEEKVKDNSGIDHRIKFFRPRKVDAWVRIEVIPLQEYSAAARDAAIEGVCNYINATLPGEPIIRTRLFCKSYTVDNAFNIAEISIGRSTETMAHKDMMLAFDEKATCDSNTVRVVTR